MAIEVLMPKLGLTMTEGTIEEWKVQEGGAVKKGDILFSVATDKLTNDVEAEADGTLLKILLPEGETAACGAVVAYLGEAGENAPASAPAVADAPAPAAEPAPVPAPVAESAPVSQTVSSGRDGGRIRISPYARKTARVLGVDVSALTGTGPNGRIIWRDVNAAAESVADAPTAAASGAACAGVYITADVSALSKGLASLNGALCMERFVEKAAAKLDGSVAVRYFCGVEGALPALSAGETAVLGFGDAADGRLRLNLAYAPSAMDDSTAAEFLRSLAALLENPLALLV
jgi:pyruvate/2-oxoglutarate dehydrogenase complex dihydrolipoamide acyltransferase (E2) component